MLLNHFASIEAYLMKSCLLLSDCSIYSIQCLVLHYESHNSQQAYHLLIEPRCTAAKMVVIAVDVTSLSEPGP